MGDARIPVLQFSTERVRGGVEEHILLLLRRLDRRYFRLHLAGPAALIETLRADVPDDVELEPVELESPGQLRQAMRFARLLRQRRIGILHSHMFHSSLLASPLGWRCRVPVRIETPHVREVWRRGWIKRHYFIDRFAGRFVHKFIAVSQANAEYLVREKGLPPAKVVVIENGADLGRFDPAHPPPAGLRARLGFSAADIVIVVLARLEPQKGHAILLEAMQMLCRDFPGARLVLLGDGSLRGELERRVAELDLQGCVHMAGYQRNVPEWLALADFTVLPSLYEGLPLSTIESLASGRPVVATAVDGTVDVVIDERTGLLVPPGDANSLAGAMRRLLGDPALSRTLGRQGREWVLQHFSIDRQIDLTQELYLRLFHQRRRAAAPALAATAGSGTGWLSR